MPVSEHGGRRRSRCEGKGRERENFEFLVKAKLKRTQKGGLSNPQLNEFHSSQSAKLLFIGIKKQNKILLYIVQNTFIYLYFF